MVEYAKVIGISKKTPLSHIINLGKNCKRCNNCCNFGSGFLVGDDAAEIARFLGISEKELKEKYLEEGERFNTKMLRPVSIRKGKQYGKCIFFHEKRGCSIHPVKPLECKISICDENGEAISIWFMLNHLVNPNDAESIRQYASYLRSHPTVPGGELEEIVPDKDRLKKILSYEILR